MDIPSLTEAFDDISYVYHCAAFVSFEPDKYQLLRKTNIEGTANIVNLCIANSIKKACYVSSIAAIGTPNNSTHITEETEWNPENPNNVYAITKYGAEMEVWRGVTGRFKYRDCKSWGYFRSWYLAVWQWQFI